MKNIHSKLLCLLSLIMTPYTLNGMLINAIRRTTPSVRYNSTQNPPITKTVTIEVHPTLPQTFLQKLFGITQPNPEYYILLKKQKAQKEEQKRKLIEKKNLLRKQLDQIHLIANAVPLEKLEAAARQRYEETQSPLAKKDWKRIQRATEYLIYSVQDHRSKLGISIPEYKESKLDDKNEEAFARYTNLFDQTLLLFPENKELLNLEKQVLADLKDVCFDLNNNY